MITPYQLLRESGFAQYTAMIRIHYNRENTSLGAEKIAEMVRAIPGATRVSTVSLDKEHGIAIFNAKIISQKPPKEAYQALKQNALTRYRGLITGLEVGVNTIETKGDFIIKESNTHLNSWLRKTLVEEGLLLEVSIEELRKQFVECDPPKLTAEIFDQIVQTCNNKSNYATWLCKKVSQDIIKQEDFQLWHNVFEFFDRHKQRFEKKDINQVKTAEDVTAFLTDYNRVYDEIEAKKSTGLTQKVKDETDQCLLGHLKTSDGQEWLVYKTVPGQWELERKIGSGTSWCTVASKDYFNRYFREYDDPAYYIFINTKNPKEKYQIHYGSDQCKDREDEEVDYASEFIQDFYKYLEKVDNRTEWPYEALRGKRELDQRKGMVEQVKTAPEVLSEMTAHRFPEGVEGTLYVLPNNWSAEKVATAFRDLGESVDLAVSKAIRFKKNARGLDGIKVILKTSAGWDILTSRRTYNSRKGWLGSIKTYTENQGTYVDTDLPLVTDETFSAYSYTADFLNVDVKTEVIAKHDPNLPGLEHFKTKSSGGKTLYKIPKDPSSSKAFLQAGLSSAYDLDDLKESTIYAYYGPGTEPNTFAVFDSKGRFYSSDAFPYTQRPEKFDAQLDILEFAGVAPDREANPYITLWKDVGREKGLVENLKNSIIQVKDFPDGYEIGKSAFLGKLVFERESDQKPLPFICRKGEYNYLVIASPYEKLWIYRYDDNLFGRRTLSTQSDYIQCSIPVGILVKFCQAVSATLPTTLERLYARSRGENTEMPNVTRTLRQQFNNFQAFNIPLYRRYQRIFSLNQRGLYGTWEQLGPLIRQSCSAEYSRILSKFGEYPESYKKDVFLCYHDNNPRSDWNGVVRVISDENKVVWYDRRSGYRAGLVWRDREIEPEQQVDAGENFTSNYTAPQPVTPTAPRGQGAAARTAPDLGTLTPEQRQQLAEYHQNIQAAQNGCYVLPTARVDLVEALGFTNLAVHLRGTQGKVVIYDAVAHRRGNVSRVALANIENQNVVILSLPGNQGFAAAQAASTRWRSITGILDNSTRTFQQCVDVCNQTHTPLPVGLQGWLAYRG